MPSKLSHPRHYAVSRPYANTMKRIGEDNYVGEQILKKLNVVADEFTFMKAISFTFAEEIQSLQKSGKLNNDEERLWVAQEPQDSQIYSMFCRSGRMIFNFTEDLTEAFNKSDLGDALIKDIKLPFDAFYIKFNFINEIKLFNNRPFDGTYVFRGKDSEFIGLLLVTGEGEEWPDIIDLGINSYFNTVNGNLHFSEALEEAYEEQMKKYNSPNPEVAELYGIDESDIDTPQKQFFQEGHETTKDLLNVIGNALLYLSIYQEEVDAQWSDDAPKSLVTKAESPKPRLRKKAHDELWGLGYSKIRYCRSTSEPNKSMSIDNDPSVAKHWRRGHWRNQPYGKGLSERKLIWLKPCLVGKLEKPVRGRDYQI